MRSIVTFFREMCSVRIPSEMGIGRVKTLFAFLEFKVICTFLFLPLLEGCGGNIQACGTLVSNNSEFLVCLLDCWLTYFLTEIRKMQGYLPF